tara:strand:- start:188 stop:565 length:378 start_codon:yes stop_codon:yes gene_type:complete
MTYSIKQILDETAKNASISTSQTDGDATEGRPYPVYLVRWNKKKNTATVRKWADPTSSNKEIPLDIPPKMISLLNLRPGDKLYYYPRSYLGNKGGVVRPGWDTNGDAYTTRKKAAKIFPNNFFGV